MANFSNQVGEVYGALGNAVESDDEAELDCLFEQEEDDAEMMPQQMSYAA